MKVITAGNPYIDIDAYASCLAYRELLTLKGEPAKAVSTSKLNESISPSLREIDLHLDEYIPNENDEFIILDLSNPKCFDKIVNLGKVIEIVDHHPGFEHLWQNLPNATIEPIGAIATLIFEKYQTANLLDKMSPEIAKLLASAILDNTLDFNAKITTNRDKNAYQEISKLADLKPDFAKNYFLECQKSIENNLTGAILDDVKTEQRGYELPGVFGQLTIWDGEKILAQKTEIETALNSLGRKWLINIIVLSEKKSYILVSDEEVGKTVTKLFDINPPKNNLVKLDPLWLRKEIIKKALSDLPTTKK